MIELKNVSKFYYKKGIIATGFRNISLKLELGEFVLIVGESGSGKSTLLNVISGLDSYEEGEMYIDGSETSHYTSEDFIEYRRKYVANIFQSFNLVDSYTVLQNIELVLEINGLNRKELKKISLSLIERVGLTKWKNTRVSKLSGGQKQRVAIARALAKNTPIIVADEPTGNLDQAHAEEIFKLLKEISKDKLVIVVTHNPEQANNLNTRIIRMHDGRITEDKKLKDTKPIKIKEVTHSNMKKSSEIILAIRNTFNIPIKFILLTLIFLFITSSLLSNYASNKKSTYTSLNEGTSEIFINKVPERIVISKNDKSEIKEEDFKNLEKYEHIQKIIKNDLINDMDIQIVDSPEWNIGFSASLHNIDEFDKKVDVGRLPTSKDEVILEGDKYDYFLTSELDRILDNYLYYFDSTISNINKKYKFKVVGIRYFKNEISSYTKMYVNSSLLTEFSNILLSNYYKGKININSNQYDIGYGMGSINVAYLDSIPLGNAYIMESFNSNCKNFNCKNKKLTLSIENYYTKTEKEFKIKKIITQDNYKILDNYKRFEEIDATVFINRDDYYKLLQNGYYQSSVLVDNVDNIDKTVEYLNSNGYKTLVIKDTLSTLEDLKKVYEFLNNISNILFIVSLFFISYAVIYLILKSRVKYYAILRMLGGTLKLNKKLLNLELFISSTISYSIFMIVVYLVNNNILNIEYIKSYVEYLNLFSYIMVYFILIILSQLISNKISKKVFKDTSINTYNMEV